MKEFFRFLKRTIRKFLRWVLPDKAYVSVVYFLSFFRYCNLDKPEYWTEKIQWKKLYDRRPLLTKVADKYRVREYVKNKIGDQVLTKIYWVGDNPEEIPFEDLPDSFVIKTNHGCGTNIIVRNKAELDIPKAIGQLRDWLKMDFYYLEAEWAYKNIPRLLFVEEYISFHGKSPEDIKFYMLNGKLQMIWPCPEKWTQERVSV